MRLYLLVALACGITAVPTKPNTSELMSQVRQHLSTQRMAGYLANVVELEDTFCPGGDYAQREATKTRDSKANILVTRARG
jgi:hypothetical protein